MKIKSAFYDDAENGIHINTDGQGEWFLHCTRKDIQEDKKQRAINTGALGILLADTIVNERLSLTDYFLFAGAREDKWIKI